MMEDQGMHAPETGGKSEEAALKTLFYECRQCGSCCKRYKKVLLEPDEIEFIKKMGGHVGYELRLNALRDTPLDVLMEQAVAEGKVYMVHPDSRGCRFLEKRNGKYYCKIYYYRPRACKGFRCNLVDSSMINMLDRDAIYLLGQDRFGSPLGDK